MSTQPRSGPTKARKIEPSLFENIERLNAMIPALLEQQRAARAEVAEIREVVAATLAEMRQLAVAMIPALTISVATQASHAASNSEDNPPKRPEGNWKNIQDLMLIYGRSETAIRKMIKKKHATVWQPGGRGTPIEVDLGSLPAPRV